MTIVGSAREAFQRVNRPVRPSVRLALNVLLSALVLGTALAWAYANISYFNTPNNLMDPFTDANTYLAAGERLNAGHDLYRLVPGDRPVLPLEERFGGGTPLLSPPPIAVFWRPLAALDLGMAVWVAATWICLLGTVVYLILRTGLPAVLLAFLLSQAIGEQLAVANAYAFVPALYIVLWNYRTRAWVGSIVAVVASVKLAPIIFGGWLLGLRNRAAVAVVAATGILILIAAGLGAGFGTYAEWLGTLSKNGPAPISISGLVGVWWGSYAALVVGGLVSMILAKRSPGLAFAIAVVASVLGTPALWVSALVPLLAILAPLSGSNRGLSFASESHASRVDTQQSIAPTSAVLDG